MTSSLLIALVLCFGITLLLVRYHQVTTKLSLEKRWELVNLIKEVEADEDYSEPFKELLYTMFTDSVKKEWIPSMILFGSWMFVTDRKNFKKRRDDFAAKLKSNPKELEVFQKAMPLMVKINMIAAPHWYIILGIVTLVMFVFLLLFSIIYEKTINIFKNGEKTFYAGIAFAAHSKN
ncbi:hypothetical protein [Campylobacter sp. RM16191]|uniref:hypothetical protein n=1 Tax=Campylobacter sp. RM16191 TaxID=1705728 RepID=UPI001473835C|nr:hypothetical protein [Campylobacter sp. RM16191]